MSDHKADPAGFDPFPWDRNFETGIELIDQQHQVLVDILNRLAQHFVASGASVDCSQILDELLSYAAFHFKSEEAIWREGLDTEEAVRNHHDSHQLFFAQIQIFRGSEASQERVLADIYDYLARWLAFHILESDRRMALTVQELKRGSTLDEARRAVDDQLSGQVSVTVSALLEKYAILSARVVRSIRDTHRDWP
ncbi:hemerythrin family protein [uncultured Marinobacter sp.]|uniref:bacteriohemerythrin n=1 Tax=uncultured Marinobacter sp. TaxID=187379 RepID=UPI0026356161|nr:hemerythrin family protein [uncultured Marinobacter sp.]